MDQIGKEAEDMNSTFIEDRKIEVWNCTFLCEIQEHSGGDGG